VRHRPSRTRNARADHSIPLPEGGSVTGIWSAPPGAALDWVFGYAPGAGSNINDPFGLYAAPRLLDAGVSTLRFQFPYMEAGARQPDRPSMLKGVWQEVIDLLHGHGKRVLIGGRSMGGRYASRVVSDGAEVDALALFAYPLHAPGKPDAIRDANLASIGVPTLFCTGTRDTFSTPEELQASAAKMPSPQVHILDGADHSFMVLKSSGRTREDVWDEVLQTLLDWLERLS
jgi:predicted alpha/beta-hydrolase family hydrolase